jgi:SAM-dependent methyltransferase
MGREARFHDSWAAEIDPAQVPVEASFSAATCPENRFVVAWLGDVAGLRLLDLGTGAGEAATYFAGRGARVTAVDSSSGMLRVAAATGAHYGACFDRVQCSAEALPFADESFDVVYGANILHHVDRARALDEVRRVLKPGSRAAFWDPLAHNPLIQIYRWMAAPIRSKDERPLKLKDLRLFRARFARVEHRTFWLLTLWIFLRFYLIERVSPTAERYWKKIVRESARLEATYARLRRWDDRILSWLPWLGRYCWTLVVCVTK